MRNIAAPEIYEVDFNEYSLPVLKNDLSNSSEKAEKLIFNYPTVYIINHKNKQGVSVYIGETSDINRRTMEHLQSDSKERDDWMTMKEAQDAKMLVIGHEMFNKSLTLDIENRIMLYMSSIDNVTTVYNRRTNDQREYYTSHLLDDLFSKVWRKLRQKNKDLFPLEQIVKDSALFKASPFHKLTKEQLDAKNTIILKIMSALTRNLDSQLIFVDGEAGTGKTVLLSSLFYDLFQMKEDEEPVFKSTNNYLLVNHDEQLLVYDQIMKKLGITKKNKDAIMKPTSFINKLKSAKEKADIVLIDEGHLLLTQGKQSYTGKNHLDDIMKLAKIVILIFDKNQILTTEQYWEDHKLLRYQDEARYRHNYIQLKSQIRINSNEETIKWIRDVVDNKVIRAIPADNKYDLRIMKTPEELDLSIREKANDTNFGLSRLLATYDWPYHNKNLNNGKTWNVEINGWSKPWNLLNHEPKSTKKRNKGLAWAEQSQTIDQVGSTFTIQGFDLNYAGVIIGPSVIYRDGKIQFDPDASYNKKATRNRTLETGDKQSFAETFLNNELNVLLTRGVNGLYIYAVDDELREALLKAQNYT